MSAIIQRHQKRKIERERERRYIPRRPRQDNDDKGTARQGKIRKETKREEKVRDHKDKDNPNPNPTVLFITRQRQRRKQDLFFRKQFLPQHDRDCLAGLGLKVRIRVRIRVRNRRCS